MSYRYIFLSLIALLGFYACKPAQNKYGSPKGYDLNSPEKFNMPESLLEISGIAFNSFKSDTVYSIQDEDGELFRQKWGEKKQQHVRFGEKGDFEDVAILKNTVFVLKSSGSLFVFPLSEAGKKKTEQVKEWKHILPKGEYESIYADEATNKIYLLTKISDEDRKLKESTGYIFTYDPGNGNLLLSGHFKLNSSQIEAFGARIKTGLRTSALSRNPRTKEWYILSSVNKLLVTADANWKVTGVYHLNSSRFNQPEGLAFDKDFNLYISNEGDEITAGNIMKFKYKPN